MPECAVCITMKSIDVNALSSTQPHIVQFLREQRFLETSTTSTTITKNKTMHMGMCEREAFKVTKDNKHICLSPITDSKNNTKISN